MDSRTSHRSSRPSDLIPTYHDQPALKPSLYGWTVALYIFVGGLSGGIQILVTAIDVMKIPDAATLILSGRAIALAGAILGGILLIIDLHTKHRFYNMLRIFRPTSPMSIGTYVLMSFGFWSFAALAAQLLGSMLIASICGLLAALSGWWMTTYTAALLAATATPLWAAAPRSLAIRFAASAMATAAAALCLVSIWALPGSVILSVLGDISALSLIVELAASLAGLLIYRNVGVGGPLHGIPWGPVHLIGVQLLGVLVPIGLFIWQNFSPEFGLTLPVVAAVCVLAGGLLMRGVILFAGNESARRPRDYFRFASETR
jgi:formate-dependent nitrite reductase membrane component NrfD